MIKSSTSKNKFFAKLYALFRIIRPINCLMIGFAVVIGEFIALGSLPRIEEAITGSLTAVFLMAGTMTVNDYYDLEIDRINRPERPLPAGILKPNQALVIGLLASAMGLILAASINMDSFVIAAFALSLVVYYNTRGKKSGFFGNILVSVCIGLPFIFGGAVVDSITASLFFFSIMSFTANLGREVTKGIMDIEGDRSRQVRTIAVVHGSRIASRFSSALYMLAVGLSLVPPLVGLVGIGYLPAVLISDLGFTSSSISILRRYDRENSELIKSRVLISMFLGLLAFIAGSINI